MSASLYTFDSPDADVILRAPLYPDGLESTKFKDFHTHKIILSTASTVFRDMFSVPQPPQPVQSDGSANLPIIHVTEPAAGFETFLRLIYPISPPAINSIQIVDHLSHLALKYMVDCVSAKLRQIIVSPSFLGNDPIWVYAIACRMDFSEEAKLAIPYTYRINLVQDIPRALLQAMTAETYNRLLRSHDARRGELMSVLKENKGIGCPYEGKCVCGSWFYTRLFKNINLAIWERPFLDRHRLNSCLSQVEGMPNSECGLGSSCRVSSRVISTYFISILDAIETLDQGSDH